MEVYVYRYEHVDMKLLTEEQSFELYKRFNFDNDDLRKEEQLRGRYEYTRNQVAKAFVKAGWEGDGRISLIWLPPFINFEGEDSWGSLIWHVKQYNNGTSFLGFVDCKPNESFRHLR